MKHRLEKAYVILKRGVCTNADGVPVEVFLLRFVGFRRLLPLLTTAAFSVCVTGAGCRRNAPAPAFTPPPAATQASPTPRAAFQPAPLGPFDANTPAQISPRCADARIPVLMYHDIIKKRGRNSVWFDCTKAEFAAQLRFIEEQGATPISLETLHKHLTRGEAVPPKAVVLTFDDNYQGFYDNAYPLLKEKNYPAAMFVHTNFVGDKKGTHPKMTWDMLRLLDKDGLVTVCSHTLSHPDDISKLPIEKQDEELTQSKAILEQQLGHSIPYFAYPVGKGDAATIEAAGRAGYTMAFMIDNGPVEESPSIMALHRYVHTRIKQAFTDCEAAQTNAPASIVQATLTNSPVSLQVATFGGVKLALVRGGMPSTWRATGNRQSVGEFIAEAQTRSVGASQVVAGMNGTFFADASLRGNGNMMIGPCLASGEGVFYPEDNAYRLTKLVNRPLIVWGGGQIAIVPFSPASMNDEANLKGFLPEVTDVFLAGAWIVHDGQARTVKEMSAYSARDFNDPRRRAFFGLMENGDVVLGGSLDVVTTVQLAKAVEEAGIREAVLMDSGFSTSVVYDNKIIVTGHTAKNLPSRPVPHAIVLTGTLSPLTDPDTLAVFQTAEPAVGTIPAAQAQADLPPVTGTKTRRRRRSTTP